MFWVLVFFFNLINEREKLIEYEKELIWDCIEQMNINTNTNKKKYEK